MRSHFNSDPGINLTSRITLNCSFAVHSALGPGMLESAYCTCLAHELRKQGAEVATQVEIPLLYDGIDMGIAYRIDLLVNDCVIVEVKAIHELRAIHETQLRSYLKMSKRKVGLLINFNVMHLKDGIVRIVNGF